MSPIARGAYGAGVEITDAGELARICRIEAARALHSPTRDLLLKLAEAYELLADTPVEISPDDAELQQAVADRLLAFAAKAKPTQGAR
jgi:hypothetical protein